MSKISISARKRLFRTASRAALASAMFVAAPALAQGQPVEDDETADPDVIVVTGFRAALETAISEKKNADVIVESVSAEDIGKLPDDSIAESIARLPGLTAQRLSGRANVVSIRGFGPDLSTTLLNGRQQTTTSDSRNIEYDQYPSEVVNQVLVYKSPSADIIGQGLAGTVDIRTIRPLDRNERVLSIGAKASLNDLGKLNSGSDEFGYRVNATYVDQFADDTVGVSLAGSYLDEAYQIQEFNAWGYAGFNDAALIGGSKSFVTSTSLKRLGLIGTLQWEPTPGLTLSGDGFYSDFEDNQIKRGIELPLGFGGGFGTQFDEDSATIEGGTVTSGTFNGVEGVIRNDAFERSADIYSFGFNADWQGDDGWNAMFDFSFSKTDRQEISIESYAGTGYGNAPNNGSDSDDDDYDPAVDGAVDTIGFVTGGSGTRFSPGLDYSDPSIIFLTDSLGWGGDTEQAGYFNNRVVEDELKQYRVEIEREFENSFVSAFTFGVDYTDRDKSLTPDESFLILASGNQQDTIPDEFLLRPTDLDYLGLGPVVSYDPLALIDAGVYDLRPNDVTDVFAKSYSIAEDIMSLYAQADLEAELGSNVLTGNIGVQAQWTDQRSTGFAFAPDGRQDVSFGDEYWDVLPQLNLSLRTASDFVIRFAAAREIQRARLDDMRSSFEYGIDTSGAEPIIRGSSGNPFLRPYRANAVDLNFEKYFGTAGYLALQLYYKDLKSYVFQNGEIPFNYGTFPDPVGEPVPSLGTLNVPFNVDSGEIYGAELAGTLPFGEFIGALDGFGLTGGVAYTKSNIELPDGGDFQIPGYSKWVANGTLYFEKYGFNLRGSVRHRTSFLGELTGFGGNRQLRLAQGETIVDAQIGYDFQDGSALEGLSLYLQGQNLTDEPFRTQVPGEPLQIIDNQQFGRRFLAGASFKF
ncbi:MAG: TonB-dependent receptor [Pacificimonas sp.]